MRNIIKITFIKLDSLKELPAEFSKLPYTIMIEEPNKRWSLIERIVNQLPEKYAFLSSIIDWLPVIPLLILLAILIWQAYNRFR